MLSGSQAAPTMLQRFCGESEPVKSPQGVDATARRLRTALFMLLQNVQAGLVFLDDEGAGSHSVRDSTFRIVSSFTFFPRSSQLLDWERVVTLPGPVPRKDASSGSCRPWALGGAWAASSGWVLCLGWSTPLPHQEWARHGVSGTGQPEAHPGGNQILQWSAVVSLAAWGPRPTPRAPAPRTGFCRVNCVLLLCLDPSCWRHWRSCQPLPCPQMFPEPSLRLSFPNQPLQANTISTCHTAKLTTSRILNQTWGHVLHLWRIKSKLGKKRSEEREESKGPCWMVSAQVTSSSKQTPP